MSENRTVHRLFRRDQGFGGSQPSITDGEGRIRLSGLPHGSYLKLAQLYSRILEAARVIEQHSHALRLMPDHEIALVSRSAPEQAPLTQLEPSRLVPHLYYKREDQTVTRAYKVRGAVVGMTKALESGRSDRFLTVSTGNHALAVLKAAELLRPASVRIVVPRNTASRKLLKIKSAVANLQRQGVQVELLPVGETFDEARNWAIHQQETDSQAYYLDPYSDPWVVAGQGTLGLELVTQSARLLEQSDYEEVVVISPVGGGGLLTGTATAMRMASVWERAYRGINLSFLGMRLEDLNAQLGDAIRVAQVAHANQSMLSMLGVPFRAMDDEHMAEGVRLVKKDIGQQVEGASGGAVYPAISHPAYKPSEKRLVISILSGANAQ
jgi:threonine dehydratase